MKKFIVVSEKPNVAEFNDEKEFFGEAEADKADAVKGVGIINMGVYFSVRGAHVNEFGYNAMCLCGRIADTETHRIGQYACVKAIKNICRNKFVII